MLVAEELAAVLGRIYIGEQQAQVAVQFIHRSISLQFGTVL